MKRSAIMILVVGLVVLSACQETDKDKDKDQGGSGLIGPTGENGSTGPTGSGGSAGIQGPTGPTGLSGSLGAQGATGPTGLQGNSGLQGATGASGAQGNAGPVGPQEPGLNFLLLRAAWSDATTYTDGVYTLQKALTLKVPALIDVDIGWSGENPSSFSATISFGSIVCTYLPADTTLTGFSRTTAFSSLTSVNMQILDSLQHYFFSSCSSGGYDPDTSPNLSLVAGNTVRLHVVSGIPMSNTHPLRAKTLVEIASFD